MSGQNKSYLLSFCRALTYLTLIGTLLFPAVEISSSFPKIEISDITFPVLLVLSLIGFRQEMTAFYLRNRSVLMILLIVFVAVASILVNQRFMVFRDWFEPLKFFKLFCFVYFFYRFMEFEKVGRVIRVSFIFLIIFNLLHYFELFRFNEVIEPFYAPPHHLDFFGLNSLGQPSTKRMLGTLGNPNNNAILFILCLLLFLPRKTYDFNSVVFSSVSIIAVIACQSRTGIISLFIVLLFYFLLIKPERKIIIHLAIVFIVGIQLFEISGNTYLGSLGDAQYLESAKVGRLEQWQRIWESMPGNWILGHGVNKEYFESRGIYAESEYFLVLFRYGFAGVISLLAFWLVLAGEHVQHFRSSSGFTLFGCITLFFFSGITNSPLHVVKLSVLLMFIIGFSLRNIFNEKQV